MISISLYIKANPLNKFRPLYYNQYNICLLRSILTSLQTDHNPHRPSRALACKIRLRHHPRLPSPTLTLLRRLPYPPLHRHLHHRPRNIPLRRLPRLQHPVWRVHRRAYVRRRRRRSSRYPFLHGRLSARARRPLSHNRLFTHTPNIHFERNVDSRSTCASDAAYGKQDIPNGTPIHRPLCKAV
jgi:hypothetical protein